MAELERKASYGLVIALSITAMIGTGMFFGPAIAASYAGNASLIAWVILALITIYVGACFAELSGIFPDVGGVYEFAKQAYGRFTSFMVGWVTWLVGTITPAVLIVAALDYLLPNQMALLKILVAVGLLIFLNLVALRGLEASTAILIFFAVITVGVILLIIGVGATRFTPQNFTPFFSGSPVFIFVSLFFIMETFFGWESATFMGGETKNPRVVLPRSIMITTVLVAVLGVSLSVIILGFVPYQTLVTFQAPFTNIAYLLFGVTGASAVNIAIFLALIGSAAGGIVSSPRLLVALAKDKLFIEQLSSIHPRFHTPHKAIFFQMIISLLVVLIAFGRYQSLLSLLVPLALMMYIATILTVPILRRKFPDLKRTFKVSFPTIGPILISLLYTGVIVGWLVLQPGAWPLFQKILSFILFGIPIYLLLTFYYNPDVLMRTVNLMATANRWFEWFIFPKSVRKEVLNLFTNIKGRDVLEFGCGVGTLTLPLAEIVGPKGTIYATDLSFKHLAILEHRLWKKQLHHVNIIHDEHLISRVHPEVPQVDMIFSIGNLSYIQDLKRVLSDMNRILPENGQVCFVEYVDYFWGVLPNQPWLDDVERLEKLFRSCGFSIRIRKRQGVFWRYLFIYGIKSEYDVPVI